MRYLVGADIGTTSLKAAVFDEEGHMIRSASRDYILNVKGEEVEFPAEKYVELFKDAYAEISEGLEISAIAFDTQGETMIVTDEAGTPLRDAIVWLDNRAAAQAESIKAKFGNKKVFEITGQAEITATWPAAKLMWIREKEPETFAKIRRVFLLEDWLIYRLTGCFITEPTLQSSTIYEDIRKEDWWDEMLEFVGIRREMLPRILPCGTIAGFYEGVPVVTGALDQIAGAIGAGVVDGSAVSEMTGTTMVIFVPSEDIPAYDPNSVVPCHKNYDGKYCLLAWTPTAGIALKWFRNVLCENFSFRELDELAEKVAPGSEGLTFLPYLTGSVMPKYRPEAKGAFMGLTMEHTRAHFVRSVLESVACMLKENLDSLGISPKEIRSMGGGASSPLWCQIKADLVGCDIVTLKNSEVACLGSALLAGKGIGICEDIAELAKKTVEAKKVYHPSGADYTVCYKNYKEASDKILG